jgi:hypothetical protein
MLEKAGIRYIITTARTEIMKTVFFTVLAWVFPATSFIIQSRSSPPSSSSSSWALQSASPQEAGTMICPLLPPPTDTAATFEAAMG